MLVDVSGSRNKWTKGQIDKGTNRQRDKRPRDKRTDGKPKKIIAFSESPCHETSRKLFFTKNNIRRSKDLLYNNFLLRQSSFLYVECIIRLF